MAFCDKSGNHSHRNSQMSTQDRNTYMYRHYQTLSILKVSNRITQEVKNITDKFSWNIGRAGLWNRRQSIRFLGWHGWLYLSKPLLEYFVFPFKCFQLFFGNFETSFCRLQLYSTITEYTRPDRYLHLQHYSQSEYSSKLTYPTRHHYMFLMTVTYKCACKQRNMEILRNIKILNIKNCINSVFSVFVHLAKLTSSSRTS